VNFAFVAAGAAVNRETRHRDITRHLL
jgi:hypothetical protein